MADATPVNVKPASPLNSLVTASKSATQPVSPPPAIDPYAKRPFGRGKRLYGVDPSLPQNTDKVREALDDYVVIEPCPQPAAFAYRGVCRECGWQTHNNVKQNAVDLVKKHAQRHLYQP